VLIGAWRLGARIGAGTVANAVLIGVFVDLLVRSHAFVCVHDATVVPRVVALIGGILVIGVASALYIGGAFGAGPRDSLMLVLSERTKRRVGVVRTVLESSVTIAGFALGGTVGVGTFAFAFGVGPAIEVSFWLLGRSPLAVEVRPEVAPSTIGTP
jgi:uncharacterized protein